MSRKLILIRHGESMGNVWKPAYRYDETNFLSDLGVKQAEIAGIYLKREGYNFEYIVSSQLTRARQTTSHILISMNDWKRNYEFESDLNEGVSEKNPLYKENRDRIFRGMNKVMENWVSGDALCVTHYFTMQSIFDYLQVPRKNIDSHNGYTVRNAIPFVYDLEFPDKIIELDPSKHGPQT